jgi:predicted secreted protein
MAEMTSNGALLQRYNGATFDTIGGVLSVSGFGGGTATIIDVTDLSDTYKQKIAGQLDGGEITVSLNADTGGSNHQDDIRTDFAAGTRSQWKITLTDTGPSTITFYAIVTNVSYGISLDDKITLDVSLAIDGGFTWA